MTTARYTCIALVLVVTALLLWQGEVFTFSTGGPPPSAPPPPKETAKHPDDEPVDNSGSGSGTPVPGGRRVPPAVTTAVKVAAPTDGEGDETLAPDREPSRHGAFRDEGEHNPSLELEFANGTKPLVFWMRKRNSESQAFARRLPSHVRMACMYAGFMRNWEWMLAACRDMQSAKFCNFPTCVKLFGNQRRHVLESTNCDVYMSTWNLRGDGRFSTFEYADRQIDPNRLFQHFGKWLYALHMQNYSHYGPLWYDMHLLARNFPQTKPTVVHGQGDTTGLSAKWSGRAETRRFLRRNDFSQAYKHWCVLRLVQMSQRPYEVYFRLRADLRVTRLITAPRRVTAKTASVAPPGASHVFRLVHPNGTSRWYGFGEHMLHVNNFDVGDFGFMGVPAMITELSERVWNYCLAEPDRSVKKLSRVSHHVIAEYNLMLWRIIFDERWTVNSGLRYLWVSRSRKRCKQKKPKPGQKGFGKPLPPVINFSVATWNPADDRD